MYSCVDENGNKVLRSDPCEQSEKPQPIVIKADSSYYEINSKGEKHGIDSYQAKQPQKSVTQSGAPKNLYERAKAEADSRGERKPELRAGIIDRFIRAYRAEHCGANAQVPKTDSAQQSLYEQAKAEADSSGERQPELRAGIMNGFMRAYRAEHCLPEEVVNSPVYIQSPPPIYIAPPPIIYQY